MGTSSLEASFQCGSEVMDEAYAGFRARP